MCKNTFIRWFLLVMVSIGVSTTAHADAFETLFKQKYKKEMLPELRLSQTDRLKAKGLTAVQIEKQLHLTADKAAICRFQTFSAYGKKFQQIAYKTLKKSTSEEATFAVTDAMRSEVQKGTMSKKEMNRRMKKAMSLYNNCVVKNDLLHP